MPTFQLRVLADETLTALPDAWTRADHVALLAGASVDDLGGMSAADVEELCLLALQDLGPYDAAGAVLRLRVTDALREGQIDQLSHELGADKQWEQYVGIDLHAALFSVGSLLWKAMPGQFPKPDAVWARIEVVTDDDEGRSWLTGELDPAHLVRLIAAGLPPRARLRRLFSDQLEGGPFPEASAIIWTASSTPTATGATIEVVSSQAWLGELHWAEPWTSDAAPSPDDDEDSSSDDSTDR